MEKLPRPIPWLDVGENFPPLDSAWNDHDPAPGLLAAGAALDVPTLIQAYAHGIFPWFSLEQPVLWWSPDPRMVLRTHNFKLHRSLRKTLQHFRSDTDWQIKFDSDFEQVIRACAEQPRAGQPGTWIVPEMIDAYCELHRAGHAHSVETWIDGKLVGGLYCVNLGSMVFGESMFARRTDASKISLAALVAFCHKHGIGMIDCQQNTRHLASLGAAEISRDEFRLHVDCNIRERTPIWKFEPVYWDQLLTVRTPDPK